MYLNKLSATSDSDVQCTESLWTMHHYVMRPMNETDFVHFVLYLFFLFLLLFIHSGTTANMDNSRVSDSSSESSSSESEGSGSEESETESEGSAQESEEDVSSLVNDRLNVESTSKKCILWI